VFLLIAAAPGRLLPTIRSRCRTLHLEPLDADALGKAVAAACGAANRELPAKPELARLFLIANGSPRRVLQFIDGGGLALFDLILAILESLPRTDWAAVHRLIALTSGRDGEAHSMAFDLLEETLANAVHGRLAGQGTGQHLPQLRHFAQQITADSLADWCELWETVRQARGEAERLNLDKAALTLTVFEHIERTARLAARRAG
jgi:DNA polymerase-3 subunit delta'